MAGLLLLVNCRFGKLCIPIYMYICMHVLEPENGLFGFCVVTLPAIRLLEERSVRIISKLFNLRALLRIFSLVWYDLYGEEW